LSGIFGVIHLDGRPVSRTELVRAMESMAYRGPHGMDAWCDGNAGLGYLALHTTPESLADRQPRVDPPGELAITADARLDNRSELCRSLGISGTAGRSIPGSRLILDAYRRWGTACAEHLLGDFAFAIWDPEQQQLFCARDHAGLRPIYYYQSRELLVFASSARAVVRCAGVPAVLDQGRVADFLLQDLEGFDRTSSFFANVKRLPPAHVAVLRDGRLSVRRYWCPEAGSELRLGSDGEYLEGFSAVFRRAVGDRLHCQVPVAVMLSGGLDSATIAGVGRQLLRASPATSLATISAIADDPDDCAESSYIRKVVGQGGLKPHFVTPGAVGIVLDRLVQTMDMMEEPWDTMQTMSVLLYLAAAEYGHLALLDGVDGDLVASLPESYVATIMRRGRLVRAWHEYRQQQANYYRSDASMWQYALLLRAALTPSAVRRIGARTPGPGGIGEQIGDSLVSRECAERVKLGERIIEHRRSGRAGERTGLRQACVDRVSSPDLTAAVERYGRVAAVCGLQHRKPFLDRRVVEFCLGLPWDQKVRNGWSKYIVRRLAETVLPGEVAWRRGWEHVGWRFHQAFADRHRPGIVETLRRNRGRMAEWVDEDRYARLLGGFESGAGAPGMEIRQLYGLATWLEVNDRWFATRRIPARPGERGQPSDP
jgi:asparagine synthase (glutamine-hydrolysing)